MLVTPQQVIQIMNLIATAGNSYEPHIKKGIESKPINVPFKKSTWEFLKDATFAVTEHKKHHTSSMCPSVLLDFQLHD